MIISHGFIEDYARTYNMDYDEAKEYLYCQRQELLQDLYKSETVSDLKDILERLIYGLS